MHLANYLGLLHKAELHLADAFRQVGDHHAAEPDVSQLSHTFAGRCEGHGRVAAHGRIDRRCRRASRSPCSGPTASRS